MLTPEEQERVGYLWAILKAAKADVTVLTPEEREELRSLLDKFLRQQESHNPEQSKPEKEYIVYFYDGRVSRMPGPLKELQKLPVKKIVPVEEAPESGAERFLPMSPDEGPPLPRIFGIRWPRKDRR